MEKSIQTERQMLVEWIGTVDDVDFVASTFITVSFACTKKLTLHSLQDGRLRDSALASDAK